MKRRRWNELSFVERCVLRETANEAAATPESRNIARALAEKKRTQRRQAKRLREFLANKRNPKK